MCDIHASKVFLYNTSAFILKRKNRINNTLVTTKA